MVSDCIIDFIMGLVEEEARKAGIHFPVEMRKAIDRRTRNTWGGSEPYIAHGREARIIERNEKIVALWDAGNHDVRMLATRFGLSTKQVRRIVRK